MEAGMRISFALATCLAMNGAMAQSYPTKPIRVVATLVAGNAGDTAMRMIAPALTSVLGQPIPIENRPQGLGQPGMLQVKESPPDGHTLLLTSILSMTSTPHLSKEVRVDTMKDFLPVVKLIDFPNLIAVNAALPVKSVAELVAYAKANPGKLTYGATGLRTGWEFFPAALGVEMTVVPYANQSVGQTVNDVGAGRLHALFYSYTSMAPVIASERVRVLAQVSRTRTKVLSHVPTVYETLPDFALGPAWFGLFAPAGTPAGILQRLNAEVNNALANPQVVAKLEALGSLPARASVEEFTRNVQRDYEVYGRLTKALGFDRQ
jgi:tripartite-type tricarboxylate transporter receptor subunit TctC